MSNTITLAFTHQVTHRTPDSTTTACGRTYSCPGRAWTSTPCPDCQAGTPWGTTNGPTPPSVTDPIHYTRRTS